MEQTFLEKLKRVKPGDLLHIIKFILAFPIAMVYRLFRRDLWLLCDTENECRDNGFWLYKYLRENTSEDAVYAINRKSPDYARVKDLGQVIQYGSFRHWIYYLAPRTWENQTQPSAMCWRFTESCGTSGRSCSMGSSRQILVFCTIRIQK